MNQHLHRQMSCKPINLHLCCRNSITGNICRPIATTSMLPTMSPQPTKIPSMQTKSPTTVSTSHGTTSNPSQPPPTGSPSKSQPPSTISPTTRSPQPTSKPTMEATLAPSNQLQTNKPSSMTSTKRSTQLPIAYVEPTATTSMLPTPT